MLEICSAACGSLNIVFYTLVNRTEADALTLFAPSLPESVTEDELWELFPSGHTLVLVPGTPRQ